MDRGIDFLKSQVNNAVMQHGTFLKNLVDHESQAEDPRFRDLCSRFIPHMQQHQRMSARACADARIASAAVTPRTCSTNNVCARRFASFTYSS